MRTQPRQSERAGARRLRCSQADGRSGFHRRPKHHPAGNSQNSGRPAHQEERIDVAARQKIESQKRTILEGSQEWDILYRKYYNEEVKKLGV